jgi:hypothetical protein
MIALISSSESCFDPLELQSLEVGLVPVVALQVFQFLLLLCKGMRMFVVG